MQKNSNLVRNLFFGLFLSVSLLLAAITLGIITYVKHRNLKGTMEIDVLGILYYVISVISVILIFIFSMLLIYKGKINVWNRSKGLNFHSYTCSFAIETSAFLFIFLVIKMMVMGLSGVSSFREDMNMENEGSLIYVAFQMFEFLLVFPCTVISVFKSMKTTSNEVNVVNEQQNNS